MLSLFEVDKLTFNLEKKVGDVISSSHHELWMEVMCIRYIWYIPYICDVVSNDWVIGVVWSTKRKKHKAHYELQNKR